MLIVPQTNKATLCVPFQLRYPTILHGDPLSFQDNPFEEIIAHGLNPQDELLLRRPEYIASQHVILVCLAHLCCAPEDAALTGLVPQLSLHFKYFGVSFIQMVVAEKVMFVELRKEDGQ